MALRKFAGPIGVVLALLAPACLAADIIIGNVAAFSGPVAPTGIYMRAGGQLYFDKINAEGGIYGAKIKVISRDDGYKVAETVRQTKALLAQAHPLALFGLVGTGNVEALVKNHILDDAGIPVVGIRSGATALIKPVQPLLFFTRASYAAEVQAIVEQLKTIDFKRAAVFYQDDPFGKDGLQAAIEALKEANIQLVAQGSYPKNTTNVAQAVKTIAAANPQAVIMVANTAASAAFVKQFRSDGDTAQLIAISVTDGEQVVVKIGSKLARGLGISQVVPDPNALVQPVTRELAAVYAKYRPAGIKINQTLLEGYIAAKVLVEGLRRAGPHPTRAKLRDALESIHNYDAGGVYIGFSPTNHSGSSFVDLTILNGDGQLLH